MLADELARLVPMTDGIEPITAEERRVRVDKAKRLMVENHIDALFLEAGTSLRYFTGVRWGSSERLTAAVIPARGEMAYVCPGFEEARLREMLVIGDDVRAWQEHENPYAVVAGILKDRGITGGRIGIEEATRFFVFDGIKAQAPQPEYVSANPVTIPCRAYKSPAEIALIQRAMEIAAKTFQLCISLLQEGMPQAEFRSNSVAVYKAFGVEGSIDVQFGKSTAFPHGSKEPTRLKEGDVVLMDGYCTLDGYYSDITRTIVFGQPTQRQRDIWNLEHQAQAAAFAAAQLGVPCEAVDAAARKVITDAGFGPDYALPGLPHRTGHGIGLDIHEWHNIVRGNKTPLAPGMCFSDEPMICIYGEFGIRLEDCIHMTGNGPQFFTQPSPSIDQPFA
jgi:Xaa-Pro dipeptidase